MKLINSQKNNAAKKQEQEQFPKVKTFPRAYAFSPSQTESASDKTASAAPFRLDERPYPLVSSSFVPDAPAYKADDPERIDLQDTLLTDESFVERNPKSHPADNKKTEEPEEHIESPHYFQPEQIFEPDETDEPDEIDEPDEAEEPRAFDLPTYAEPEAEDEDDSFFVPESDTEYGVDQLFSSEPETGFDPDSFYDPDSDSEAETDPFFTEKRESENDTGFAVENGFFPESGSEPDSAVSGIDQLFPMLEAEGKTSLTGTWQPMEDADGYDVFFAPGGESFDGVYRTLSPEKTNLLFKHLEKKTIYKMRVSAFILSGGQKSYICESDKVHCITGGGTKKHTNAAAVKIKDSRMEMIVGDKKAISASVIGQDPEKEVIPCGSLLRYLSEDTSVAVVSKEGKVKAVAPGKCRIFVIAPNGIRSSVEVSVQESAETVAFRKKNYSVRVGKTINLKKKLKSGTDSSKGSLKWKSSDKDVAEVSRKGIVTALKKGRITVWVKTKAGSRAKVRIRISAARKPVIYPWESIGISKKSSLDR